MRIIAGTHRGRPILGPTDDQTTRPITDRVKESLFNRLLSLGVLGYGQVADVFCGTGSLGLEAVSRGAEHCTFVDQDRGAVDQLRLNIADLDEAGRSYVTQTSALSPVWNMVVPAGSLTLVFIDPPYAMMTDPAARPGVDQLLAGLAPKLEDGGVLVLRTETKTDDVEPVVGFDGPMSFAYGGMTLHFYQRPMGE